MELMEVYCPNKSIKGTIQLNGSKSISNRALLIQALCKESFEIYNLSNSDDTQLMQKLLLSDAFELDAHHAGTTFRFLTAYLATKEGEYFLTGSERMKQRPIKALVEALNCLGADIEYAENEGYPPLKIKNSNKIWENKIILPANISSQYITALLLIAPTLERGLTIELLGDIVSRPYIEMTTEMMSYFGVTVQWHQNIISVDPQEYKAMDFYVEADWSAASYFYSIAAIADEANITLKGLHKNSLQGDSECLKIGETFGINTVFGNKEITLVKVSNTQKANSLVYDFLNIPDIAQSFCVTCAALGMEAHFKGLKTLKIKETDRIAALKKELAKVSIKLEDILLDIDFTKDWEIKMACQSILPLSENESFETYHDHRMAMSFAPLAMLFPIKIQDPNVVGKSYPDFWKDLASLGFQCLT